MNEGIFLDKDPRNPIVRGRGDTGSVTVTEGIVCTMKTYQPKAGEIDRR
jgi:hypothetical protein